MRLHQAERQRQLQGKVVSDKVSTYNPRAPWEVSTGRRPILRSFPYSLERRHEAANDVRGVPSRPVGAGPPGLVGTAYAQFLWLGGRTAALNTSNVVGLTVP